MLRHMGTYRTTAPDEPAIESTLSALLFQLGRELYAIPAEAVREIARYRSYTPVPGAPHTLPGIISQRGAILPVIELRPLLGLPEAPLSRAARLVVAHVGDVEMALIIETVIDLIEFPLAELTPPPPTLTGPRAALLRGVITREAQPVALIDLEALVAALGAEG